jgi:hypothetical protein
MAIKTFTTGEVLTASDTNTYLNNGGLVYISETTLSINTQINNCFTTTYRNYRIVVNIDAHSGSAINTLARLSSGGTPVASGTAYLYSGAEQAYASSGWVTYANNGANTYWLTGRLNGNTPAQFIMDVLNPQSSTLNTFYKSQYTDMAYSGVVGGAYNATTSFDGIQILLASGTSMSGKVFIYGYRQA